jgi:hypothetical protein
MFDKNYVNRHLEDLAFQKEFDELNLDLSVDDRVTLLSGTLSQFPELNCVNHNDIILKADSGQIQITPSLQMIGDFDLVKFVANSRNKKLLFHSLWTMPILGVSYVIIASIFSGNYWNLLGLVSYPMALWTSNPNIKLNGILLFCAIGLLAFLLYTGEYSLIHIPISLIIFYGIFGGLRTTVRQIVAESAIESATKFLFLYKSKLIYVFQDK